MSCFKPQSARFRPGHALLGIGLIACFALNGIAGPKEPVFDYSDLRLVPVFHDDRAKPLDSFAREHMRLVTGREYFKESKIDNKKGPHEWLARDPVTNLLSMLFEASKWQDIPVIHVDKANVKEVLGMDSKAEWTSYNELRNNQAFADMFMEIRRKRMKSDGGEAEKLTPLENKVAEMHGVLNAMDGVFTGMTLEMVPGEGEDYWLSLGELASLGKDDTVRDHLYGVMNAFTEEKPAEFKTAAASLAKELRSRGHEHYPSLSVLEQELTYNEVKPFRRAWMFLLLGSIFFAVAMGLGSPKGQKISYAGGWLLYLGGFLMCSYALYLRVVIAGRPPVSNMYESVVYMGWGVLLFAGIFEIIYRQSIFGLCGAAMGVLVLIMADMLPFDPAISPLVPVLRSNYWLIIHVMTIVISYSAFGLAMMIGHFSLGAYLFAPQRKVLIRTANNFVYRSIQVGVLLLAAGTILGGVWANESWGRFWGWDPKETWAFISLMGYLALLHARYTGMVGPFGMAVGSVVGFQLIIMTWYGVNFVLAAGLHSYGFGAGGLGYLIGYEAAELAFMALVAFRYKLLGPHFKQMLAEESQAEKTRREPVEDPDPAAEPTLGEVH